MTCKQNFRKETYAKAATEGGGGFAARQPPLWVRSYNDTTSSTKCVEFLDYPSYHHLLHSPEFLPQFSCSSNIGLRVVDELQILMLNRVLRRVFGPKRDEVTGEWRKLHNEELSDLYSLPNIVRVVKLRRMR